MAASKKLMISAAALAAVIGLGGFAAYRIMQQRAVAEVEEQFRAFGSVFAKAEHGPIEVDIWNRTLKITNISLQPKDAAADTAILIAGLNAIGTDRGQDPRAVGRPFRSADDGDLRAQDVGQDLAPERAGRPAPGRPDGRRFGHPG